MKKEIKTGLKEITSPNSFLDNEHANFRKLLKKLEHAALCISQKGATGPKYPVDLFNYELALAGESVPEHGKNTQEVFSGLSEITEGSFRVNSPRSLFNMVPNPLLDTVAAGMLMQSHNVNAIMDTYGGKSLLFEQKVARSIGKLIGWDEAFGISCNGGKLTMLYAIRAAIRRIAPDYEETGVPNDLVILAPTGGHYSIEQTCSVLGLGSRSCIRVAMDSRTGMKEDALKEEFLRQVRRGKRVAAIISCGGTTIDFMHDDTALIHSVIDDLRETCQLDYKPYLHLDSVIGWLWFTFLGLSRHEIDWVTGQTALTEKILNVTDKLSGVSHYDSVGIDFHKNGLCPYSSSFYIAKDMSVVNGKSLSDHNYGELRAFEYTVENTRPANGIASAWTSIQRMGLTGYRKYLADLHKASDEIKKSFEGSDDLKVINTNSLGWEIVFTINFRALKDGITGNYDKTRVYESFIRHIWKKADRGEDVPHFSIIKNYGEWFGFDRGAAFILYNMNIHLTAEEAGELTKMILKEADEFQAAILEGKTSLLSEEILTPIR